MAIKHRQLIRKEILTCRCMRYVYEKGLDVVYCERHSQLIKDKEGKPEVKTLMYKLYTDPPFVPKIKKNYWKIATHPVPISLFSISAFFAMVFFLAQTPPPIKDRDWFPEAKSRLTNPQPPIRDYDRILWPQSQNTMLREQWELNPLNPFAKYVNNNSPLILTTPSNDWSPGLTSQGMRGYDRTPIQIRSE